MLDLTTKVIQDVLKEASYIFTKKQLSEARLTIEENNQIFKIGVDNKRFYIGKSVPADKTIRQPLKLQVCLDLASVKQSCGQKMFLLPDQQAWFTEIDHQMTLNRLITRPKIFVSKEQQILAADHLLSSLKAMSQGLNKSQLSIGNNVWVDLEPNHLVWRQVNLTQASEYLQDTISDYALNHSLNVFLDKSTINFMLKWLKRMVSVNQLVVHLLPNSLWMSIDNSDLIIPYKIADKSQHELIQSWNFTSADYIGYNSGHFYKQEINNKDSE